MKESLKWVCLTIAACGAFLGCSQDNGESAKFSVEDSFEILLAKSSYVYKAKDSLLVVKEPVCREKVNGGLKYLEWKKDDHSDTLKISQKKDSILVYAAADENPEVFSFEGRSFPRGNWVKMRERKRSIRLAQIFSSDEIKSTFQYDGACFMKSFYSQLFEKNESLDGLETALGNFYLMFSEENNPKLDTDELIEDIRVPDCNELSLYDGEVSVRVSALRASSGKLILRYKNKSCPVEFTLRYANSESDCKTAYDEYKLDQNGDQTFRFSDYNRTLDYSYNCISDLVKNLRKDTGTLKKSIAVSDEMELKNLANSAVDLILSGLK